MRNRIFAISILTILFACNQAEKRENVIHDSAKQDTKEPLSNVVFKDSKKAVIFADYVELKDALVKSDAKAASTSAKNLKPLLAEYEGCEKAAGMANRIAESADIRLQRAEFTDLSTDLIALFKNAELSGGTIYVQHCPMANKGNGGDWLSKNKEIRNPYYGNDMLSCGSVVEEIKAK